MELFDPETEFLVSKRETGNEWELFKENVRPLKRGRKIELLNSALKSHSHNLLGKSSLLHHRRQLIEAIDDYKGDDPLHPWIQCIKWVQEAFPPGGDSSGLVVIYEQCVRTFWHSDRYRDDLRYLKVWLEYAENCVDAQVIYSFLDANGIGKTHSQYYISYALHLESNNKLKLGNEILNLGISRNAQPIEKLKDAYRKFLARSMTRQNATAEDAMEKCLPVRSFGTVLARGENRTQTSQNSDMSKKNSKQDRGGYAAPFNIYKDSSVVDTAMLQQQDISETDLNSWLSLGGRAERNKENNAIPTKWTSYKIPQRPGPRTGGTSACIEVFVDEECEEMKHKKNMESGKSSTLKLRQGDERDLKKEAELLRENPLRYFPPASLPR
ncbi:mitotic spindle checkpoint protein BUBR1 [Ziziphus jujuba]|uniref:Mitotic spindle checkpoint protein BUBR1 n=1 Tax=Ziziphus jujuba TaxID=326968 RepID=A0A6P3ZLV9_ZIZJJ|nr:mitotic spindle checkpoint protein BUBR1 [Ziziphus jujuba]XP_048332547.1 mitotic spindle checkpoint protein BUBR1 [Ziziphus jujuba]XP_060673449.1 mitotic spindle checkpoint protein BUBR1 [Ziziphus jujuba]XP_060673451.1 mitotic spindle checkpoint protein BUBR1 [Ziziphus jujuba]